MSYYHTKIIANIIGGYLDFCDDGFFSNFPFLFFLVFSKINKNIASVGPIPLYYKEGEERERER